MAAYVVGHKNPDTDSVISAIAIADLKTKLGTEATPVVQGEIPPEAKFVMDKFGLSAPATETDATGKELLLVDHSDKAQCMDNLDKVGQILGVYDHHKLGDITTPNPLEMWVWPVGCTATVIKSMYDFYGVEIPKDIAGGLLCAILSDTVLFKSVTSTDWDEKAVDALAKIAGVSDTTELGMEMFKVKSAVEGAPIEELMHRDYKNFDMSGKKVGIGQLEVVDLSMLEPIKSDMFEAMKKTKDAEGHHSIFLMFTDIMKEGTELLIVSDDPSVVEKAFDVKVDGDTVWLDGVMSRKKQVVPNMEKAFA
jgi:manganese-dependent inorganic pyrophosphatase